MNFLEKYSAGWKTESDTCYYDNTAINSSLDTSVCTSHLVPGVGLNIKRTRALQSHSFNSLNACSYSEPQLNQIEVLVKWVSGFAIAEL